MPLKPYSMDRVRVISRAPTAAKVVQEDILPSTISRIRRTARIRSTAKEPPLSTTILDKGNTALLQERPVSTILHSRAWC